MQRSDSAAPTLVSSEMLKDKKILCVIGTRPEVIKMAPVVKALRARGFSVSVLATAQHRGLLDQMLKTFELSTDWDFDLMRPDQGLAELTGIMIPKLDKLFRDFCPDAILAQGDTTTVFCSAMAAFYSRVPFGHVEAGLRSGTLDAPFPEEAMRKLTAVLTRWHFAPTASTAESLLREGYPENTTHIVGNTVIDSLLGVAEREDLPWPEGVPELGEGERLVLVTLHRRESFGEPLQRILETLRNFAVNHKDARLIYPVHPNPNVRKPVTQVLGGIPNVNLIEPVDYCVLVNLMKKAYLVFTDSGGIQEEAPALGKPVMVFRDKTERPESVSQGGAVLVGSDPQKFSQVVEPLWNSPERYQQMARPRFPYGDGTAALKIADILANDLR